VGTRGIRRARPCRCSHALYRQRGRDRSHIVNRRWARGFRRDGDQGRVILDGEPRLEVPVSRNNVRQVQATLLQAA
jgi:hypothetical protein